MKLGNNWHGREAVHYRTTQGWTQIQVSNSERFLSFTATIGTWNLLRDDQRT